MMVAQTGSFGGVFELTQTIQTNVQRAYTYSGNNYVDVGGVIVNPDGTYTNPGVMVDRMSYPGYLDGTTTLARTAGVGHVLASSDSPYSQLGYNYHWPVTPSSWWRVDTYTQTLMYNPGTPGTTDSIWIPVGSLTWGWSAYASYNSATQTYVGSSVYPSGQFFVGYNPTDTFPTWTHQVAETAGVWNSIRI